MRKQIIILLLCISVCSSPCAQESNLLSTVSPKLRRFVVDNPAAIKMLTNAFSDAFSSKTVRLYYFYSDDESEERAFHYYPNTVGLPEVIICVRENQHPLDEFITVLFETLNSKGENRFRKLFEDAKAGTISRTEFARAVLRVELEAHKSTRDLLVTLKLSKKKTAKSHYYGLYLNCPSEFESFLSYIKRVSPHRDVIEDYGLKYDSFRKMQ